MSLSTLVVNAQFPSQLYDDWFYKGFEVDLGGFVPLMVEPPVNPTVTIEEDLSFHGTCACNTFSGTFTVDMATNELVPETPTRTYNVCEYASHTALGDEFIYWFETDQFHTYHLIFYGSDLQLMNPNGFGPRFGVQPLFGVEDFGKHRFILYSNPVENTLQISSFGGELAELEILTINGLSVLTQQLSGSETTLNLSSLESGFYVVTIQNDLGRDTFKIVKL